MLKENLEIKDYTLKRFLGKGGFGEVWLAEKKIEIADKKVPFALKFISGDAGGVSDYETVKREINTWIDASGHKNIISVQDGFVYENAFVIVSEYANNGSLRQWLRTQGGKIASLEKCVEIMGGILDGLTHLHAQNIIHRDLKPENVLLKGDIPCIADFGVSRIVENNSLEISAGTNTAGSPLYMSPESFERIKPVPQIDIWSAGVMLFEMLSGRTPYAADTIPGLIYEIVTKEPRPLPADIPQSFHRVVKKALSKNVADRFSSAREMREELMRALYTQHLEPADGEVETVDSADAKKEQTNGKAAEMHLLETLPLSEQMNAAEFKRRSDAGSKKTFALLGLGAAIILAGAFLIFTFSRSSAVGGANRNESNFNRAVVETNADNGAANDANTKSSTVEMSPERPAEKAGEQKKSEAEADKPPPIKKTTAPKNDAAPKKDAPKQNQTNKRKVTLDDLIDNK